MLEELVERVRRIERNQPPLLPSVAVGDIVTLGDKNSVIRNKEDARRLEQLLAVTRLVEGPARVTVNLVQDDAPDETEAEGPRRTAE